MNRQFDLAIADYSAALKLNNSPSTLLQRAASQRANGAYEDAIADCTAALAIEVRDDGLEIWDIYNERGYAEFLAARYDAAAADFDKALALGASARAGDVLWLPYQLAWLHIAHARAGRNDIQELESFSGKIDRTQWPGTLISFFSARCGLRTCRPHRVMARWDADVNAICRFLQARTLWENAIASKVNSGSCAPAKSATFIPCNISSPVPNLTG